MLKISRLPILALIVLTLIFYGWSLLFKDNVWLQSFGLSLLSFTVSTISVIWLFQAYRRVTSKLKTFWLLLSIGSLSALIGDFLWYYYLFSNAFPLPSSSPTIFWIMSSFFFLVALIYKTKAIGVVFSNKSYVFNIIIYMVTATAISFHYLIKPVIATLDNSFVNISIAIGFQFIDLGIFFFLIILYYLIQFKRENNMMIFVVIGLLFQVTADSIYAFFSVREIYQTGNSIDLLWLASSLFIGFAGFYAKDNSQLENVELKNPFVKRELLFAYASTVVLIVLVAYSYEWNFNALSLALFVAIMMIMARQVTIMKKHDHLLMEFRHLAYHDPLTHLRNRLSFTKDIGVKLQKNNMNQLALLLIDIDRFKVINDTLGHFVGDQVLIKISERLRKALGKDAHIYRLGGDEFVIILPEASDIKATSVAESILTNFKKSFLVNDYEIKITPSIGISIFPIHANNSEDLLKNADAAMYLAKDQGKNNYKFYNNELNQTMARKMKIEHDLSKAIEREQLTLFYQPKVDLHSKRIIGMEALLRWNHPELGSISPTEFIPIAEETGQIVPIGEWVLQKACKQNKRWLEQGLSTFSVSVNVSVRQFQQGDFLQVVRKALKESDLEAHYLEIEITESIMQNTSESIEIMMGLKDMGVKKAIDDFGKGYSSLHILRNIPIDTLKIDKSFIDDLEAPSQYPFIKAIIELGLNLNVTVVAEGIENENQRQILLANKCTIGQGYLFSKPLDPTEFEKLLQSEFTSAESLLI